MPDLAEILRVAGPSYQDRYGERMLPSHGRVMRHIVACRTPALGGHLWTCARCGQQRPVYHSCRDRHCPTCQTDHAQHPVASPVMLSPAVVPSLVALSLVVAVTILFMRTGWRISRFEGLLLILMGAARWTMDFTFLGRI